MEITLAEERMLRLGEAFSADEALTRVEGEKVTAFGTVSRLLLRPKPEDIALTYQELRYEPFWHIRCRAHYVYDRSTTYTVPVTGPEVQAVTISETRYEVHGAEGSVIEVLAVEHCEQEQLIDRYLDAVSGEERPWANYLDYPAQEVGDPQSFPPPGTLTVAPSSGPPLSCDKRCVNSCSPSRLTCCTRKRCWWSALTSIIGQCMPSNIPGRSGITGRYWSWMDLRGRSTPVATPSGRHCRER